MIVFVIYILIATLVYVLGQKVLSKFRKLPPGPIRWPLVGSIPQMMMIDTAYPYKQIFGLANKYGPIMSVGFGVNYTVIVNSFDLMKQIFKLNEVNSERFLPLFALQRSNYENLGIAFGFGEVWKNLRRFTIKGLKEFGFGKSRSMDQTYQDEVNLLLDDISSDIASTGGIWEVQPTRFAIVIINIVWSSVGGYRFDENSQTIKQQIRLGAETFEMSRPNAALSVFPFLKIFPELSGYNQNGRVHQSCRNFIKELIEDVRLKRGGRTEPATFVEAFLDEIEKNKENPNSLMTHRQLETILMDLFLGGTDTTGTALTWLILYLTVEQRVQDKVREEIRQATENWTKKLTVVETSRLPYLSCCIYEAMRHSPFVTLPLPRRAIADIEINDYKIPKGSTLIYNLYSLARDKEFWGENVEDYVPERFLNSTGDQIDKKKLERLPEFGLGTRACPGEAIAMDTLTVTAVGILSKFKIGLVPGREAKYENHNPSLIISPKPYFVKLDVIQH